MYPAMLNITNQKITIVGGGKVAYRKAKMFLTFGGVIQVIAPYFYNPFDTIKQQIQIIEKEATLQAIENELKESFIVVAATDQTGLNKAIGEWCRERRILCNVIDDIHLSSFIVPAYMKRGDLIIGISTNGKSPSLAKQIKRNLEETYDETYSEYVDVLGRLRERVLREIEDEEEKKVILQYAITLDLEALKAYEKSDFTC